MEEGLGRALADPADPERTQRTREFLEMVRSRALIYVLIPKKKDNKVSTKFSPDRLLILQVKKKLYIWGTEASYYFILFTSILLPRH